jgi:hypothetical protein
VMRRPIAHESRPHDLPPTRRHVPG